MTSVEDSADFGPDEFAVESPVQIVAKSSLWQGFLRTASVLSTSLLLELFSKLLENRVGQSPTLASASSWLSRIAILVVLIAAAYLILRRLATMRDRLRVRRETRLTADLISPGPAVKSSVPQPDRVAALTTRREYPNPSDCRQLWTGKVVRVLDALPFEQYEAAALYDLVSAVLTARRRLPLDEAPQPISARAEIDRMTRAGVLDRGVGGRIVVWRGVVPRALVLWVLVQRMLIQQNVRQLGPVRLVVMWRVLPDGICRPIDDEPEWDAGLPALVRHHADLATRWAAALDTRRLSAGAQRWFGQEAEHLVGLIRVCGGMRKQAVRDAAVPDLLRIADGLDRWYARNGWSAAKNGLAEQVSKFLTAQEQPVEYELTRIRLADADRRLDADGRTGADSEPDPAIESSVSWLHRYKAPLTARRDEREAWKLLARQTSPEKVKEAGKLLERAWRRLPARDAAGSVSLLIDLAIVRLHEGRLEAARNCLAVAQTLAGDDRDPAGLAHVYETLGVLRWIRGEPRRALHDWQRALTRFRDLNHDLGTSRCLQHLGSAIAEFPEYGGLLVSGEPWRGEVLRQAGGWLAQAVSMREAIGPDADSGRGPAELPANKALARVREQLTQDPGLFDPRLGPPTGLLLECVDSWPLPAPEDAGSLSRES
ncbi:tetratricopeptide repeat protein [Nocardia miyunensis]|uniref:tetratricopeptide repeat protein n=1 Tax=Nocardia miyunensis TaxID=282684 RepID=UPI00082B4B09|nr:tetratricopeptide repeat protein [Nocardia miyunensis]